jgi:hypothetical protein
MPTSLLPGLYSEWMHLLVFIPALITILFGSRAGLIAMIALAIIVFFLPHGLATEHVDLWLRKTVIIIGLVLFLLSIWFLERRRSRVHRELLQSVDVLKNAEKDLIQAIQDRKIREINLRFQSTMPDRIDKIQLVLEKLNHLPECPREITNTIVALKRIRDILEKVKNLNAQSIEYTDYADNSQMVKLTSQS